MTDRRITINLNLESGQGFTDGLCSTCERDIFSLINSWVLNPIIPRR